MFYLRVYDLIIFHVTDGVALGIEQLLELLT